MADPRTDLQVVRRPVDGLVPYARNARTHSAEQVAQIAASVREFGWTNPVLIDEQGGIIAGHGRVMAARMLKLADVPCIVLGGLTETQRRAYVLADNKLALNAGWDESLLRIELQDLVDEGYDLKLTGFDDDDLSALLAEDTDDSSADSSSVELSELADQLLDRAWGDLLTEWAGHIDETGALLSPNITPRTAAVWFLLAKFGGKEFPQIQSLAFCPSRLRCAGDKYSLLQGLQNVARDPDIVSGYRWATGDVPSFDKMVTSSGLAVRGAKMPADFPACLARDLMVEFKATRVLDPCHGWGGRFIGFLLAGASVARYVGCDPNENAHEGLKAARTALAQYAESNKAADFIRKPFEDADLKDERFDFALTSPPYFDTEKYPGKEQSRLRYKTIEAWTDGFYLPMIRKTRAHLEEGSVFVLQVGSQRYPLAKIATDNARACGFDMIERRDGIMPNNYNGTDDDSGETALILRAV